MAAAVSLGGAGQGLLLGGKGKKKKPGGSFAGLGIYIHLPLHTTCWYVCVFACFDHVTPLQG